jgi:DNA polymerase-3 subunit alpha
MRALFPEWQDACDNTIKIANMCNLTIKQYDIPQLKECLPRFELPKEFQTHGEDYQANQNDYVRHIVETGLVKRYGEITPEIRERAEYEMDIIFSMGFAGYFLIVWEFINWAKEHNKPIGPGRGSGAGSLVAYAMTITDIDPFRFKLLFERFLNPERVSMPDFDIDMDFDYRQDIIQHTRELYGEENVGHIVTFGTLKPKNCIADVGRVLNIPLSEVNMLKKCIPDSPKAKLKNAFEPANDKFPDGGQLIPYKDDPKYKELFDLAFRLEGVKRNTGLHASGMVIGLTELPNWAPIFKDYKTGEVGVQYTMDIIEPCGLVKFDYLGLKTLSLIRYAETIINKHKKPGEPDLITAEVSETDPLTFELFKRGDSVAVFQFESPGMQKILRQFQPEKLEDLVALNALYRPGPMDCIPQYIDGKWKPETIHYPDPCLEDILKETYGVMVYQEQVMQVSQKIAGFSLGGADMLRRAMGKKKPEVLMGKKKEFIEGAVKQGFTEQHADEIFEIMVPFAGYGFNKSHAAAYSVLAYRTGWLKAHYPAEFMAANLTNEITSTDGLPFYIEEARRMGVPVDAPDVNRSDVIFDVVDGRIVFGLKGIKGMGENAAAAIVKERETNGPFESFMDFIKRVGALSEKDEDGREKTLVNKKAIEVLIKTGAFDNVGKEIGQYYNRPTLLANMEEAIDFVSDVLEDKRNGQGDLFGDLSPEESASTDFQFTIIDDLPTMQLLDMELECIGCYVSGHPLDDYKKAIENSVTLKSSNIARIAAEDKAEKERLKASGAKFWQLRDTGRSFVALGMILDLRVIRTKSKNEEMAFCKLQDLEGSISCTFFPKTWETLKDKIENNGIYAFRGKVDGSRDEPGFLVDTLEDADSLESQSKTSIHLKMDAAITSVQNLMPLRDFLFDNMGSCSVYFHLSVGNKPYVVKGGEQLKVAYSSDLLKKLSDMPSVNEVWAE